MAKSDESNKTGWEKFVTGKWVKTAPTKVGHYPVADRNGEFRGICQVDKTASGELTGIIAGYSQTKVAEAWRGWWWSHPLPTFPIAKEWDE